MKRIALLMAVTLGGCSLPSTDFLIAPGAESDAYHGTSQVPALEAAGFVPVAYDHAMWLVPCVGGDPLSSSRPKLSVAERIAYQKAHGGYLADCNQRRDKEVWGVQES